MKEANSSGQQGSESAAVIHDSRSLADLKRLCAGIAEPTIFDVGAYRGQMTKAFRGIFPDARIFTFEPFPESFNILERSNVDDHGIRNFNFGLADEIKTSAFHSNLSSQTNSLLPTDPAAPKIWGKGLLETKEVVQAEFKTIDSVLAELEIPEIDILKLDVQGAEHLVLEGASSACEEGKIKIVYTELIIQSTYVGQKRLDEALAVYYNSGFELYNLYNLFASADGKLCQLDALFTKKI